MICTLRCIFFQRLQGSFVYFTCFLLLTMKSPLAIIRSMNILLKTKVTFTLDGIAYLFYFYVVVFSPFISTHIVVFFSTHHLYCNFSFSPAGSRLRPKTLQVVDVPILDSRLCEDWHRQKGINVIIYDEMMCAG